MFNFLKGCRKDLYDIPIRDSLTHCIQEQKEEILSCSFFMLLFRTAEQNFFLYTNQGKIKLDRHALF